MAKVEYPIPKDKWLRSRHEVVRCPWCGCTHDFREIAYEGGMGQYENGATVECHKLDPKTEQQVGCGRHMQIVKVEPTTLISVRCADGPGGIPRSIGGI